MSEIMHVAAFNLDGFGLLGLGWILVAIKEGSHKP